MSDKKDNEEYKGQGKFVSAVNDGMSASMLGGVAGTVAGAIMHNEEKSQAAIGKILESGKKVGFVKDMWHSKFGKATIVGTITTVVGLVVGAIYGARQAGKARKQFDEITGENKELKVKLSAAEDNISQIKSVISQTEKPKEKSFTANLEAARSQQQEQQVAAR